MKTYIDSRLKAFTLAATMLALGACSDEIEAPGADDRYPTDITLTLQMPVYDEQPLVTRAATRESVTSVKVFGYNASGNKVSEELYTGVTGNKVTISLPKGTVSVQFVANADDVTSANKDDLKTKLLSQDLTAGNPIPMWGSANLSDLIGTNNGVTLWHVTAKVQVSSTASGFTLEKFAVRNYASQGYVADPGTVSTISTGTDGVLGTEPVYVYETKAGMPYIILQGKYDGTTYFYKAGFFIKNSEGKTEAVDVRRNRLYTLTISEVTGPGASTLEAACAGDYSNRVKAILKESLPEIYDIIGSNDFALGVCTEISVAAAATTATGTVVTVGAEAAYTEGDITVTIPAEDQGWLTKAETALASSIASGTYNSPARKYNLNLTLTANSSSTNTRSTTITVRFKGLERTIKVTQAGTDFKRDPDRKVTLRISSTTVTNDYFGWIDGTVNASTAPATALLGVKPENNRNAVRNQGLHFSTEADGADYEYRIPVKTGDVLAGVGSSKISVTQSGSEWVVKLNGGSTPETTMWISEFIIKNAEGIQIPYPVYRTGIIHKITQDVANTYQQQASKIYGWFYYETVAVTGTDGQTYYMLDRNLAASDNSPFSVANAQIAEKYEAVGAYYRISGSTKGMNIKPQICPAGFTVPGTGDARALNIKVGQFTTSNGSYFSSYVDTKTASSKLERVFIPAGGYTEDTDAHNTNHANFWCGSFLSGAQGFSTSSPEYKAWFLYYDGYGDKSRFSNMRYANGGAGIIGEVYKGMPVRCIRQTATNKASTDYNNADTEGLYTIYWRNTVGWAQPKIYISAPADLIGNWDSAPNMIKVDGETDLWMYTTVPTNATKVMFHNGSGNKYPDSVGWDVKDNHVYDSTGDKGIYNPGATGVTDITIYWDNSASPASWTSVKVHYTSATGDTTWPGINMTKGSGNTWSATVPSDALLWFNNGSSGGNNQYPATDGSGLTATAGSTYKFSGDSKSYIYFYDKNSNYGTPYAYFWRTASNTWQADWNTECVLCEAVTGHSGYYRVEIMTKEGAAADHVIFRNNALNAQTADFKIKTGNCYDVGNQKDEEGYALPF